MYTERVLLMRRVECLQIQCNHVQSKYHCIHYISRLSISYTHMTEAHPDKGHWILQADLLHNFVCSKKLVQCHIPEQNKILPLNTWILYLCSQTLMHSIISHTNSQGKDILTGLLNRPIFELTPTAATWNMYMQFGSRPDTVWTVPLVVTFCIAPPHKDWYCTR